MKRCNSFVRAHSTVPHVCCKRKDTSPPERGGYWLCQRTYLSSSPSSAVSLFSTQNYYYVWSFSGEKKILVCLTFRFTQIVVIMLVIIGRRAGGIWTFFTGSFLVVANCAKKGATWLMNFLEEFRSHCDFNRLLTILCGVRIWCIPNANERNAFEAGRPFLCGFASVDFPRSSSVALWRRDVESAATVLIL